MLAIVMPISTNDQKQLKTNKKVTTPWRLLGDHHVFHDGKKKVQFLLFKWGQKLCPIRLMEESSLQKFQAKLQRGLNLPE
jgi:hypothetical protein